MKRKGYLSLLVVVTAIVLMQISVLGNANRVMDERYAVGGEIVPVTATPLMVSLSFLIVIMAIATVVAAGVAIISSKIKIEFITE